MTNEEIKSIVDNVVNGKAREPLKIKETEALRHLRQFVPKLERFLTDSGVRMAYRAVVDKDSFRGPPIEATVSRFGWCVRLTFRGRFLTLWDASQEIEHTPPLGWMVWGIVRYVDVEEDVRKYWTECGSKWADDGLRMEDENADKVRRLRRFLGDELFVHALDMVRSEQFEAGIHGHAGESR